MSTAQKLATLAHRFFLDRQADFWAQHLGRAWAVSEVRARVVAIVPEAADVKTLVLEPNGNWRGHRAGQYIPVDVEIDGVRARRCYSLSSAPGAARLAITVRRVADGHVSPFLHERVRVGDVLGIGAAAGDFVLPEPTPPQLLFVSGGSGITPVMSMLRWLDERDDLGDVVFVHYSRSRWDVIFGAELDEIAARRPSLRLHVIGDDDPVGGGFDEARLATLVPDYAARATFLCGPPGLMARVEKMWHAADASHHLQRERFTLPSAIAHAPVAEVAQPVKLLLGRSARTIGGDTAGTLLDQLERAGERPAHGCRMGICHSCKCPKRSGTVRNLSTGEVSSTPDEDIQLCISVPLSDVELGL
jgi:ferredoxin-NADP reductase